MLASVLNSDEAVKTSVAVVRAFNRMRRIFAEQKEPANQLDKIGKKVINRMMISEDCLRFRENFFLQRVYL